MKPLPNLLENEKIVAEVKPTSFSTYFFSLYGVHLLILLIGFPAIPFLFPEFIVILVLYSFLVLVIFLVVLIAKLSYGWEFYWITNLRVIQRKGLIGYNFYSTPYERMSDVILSKNWLERILNVGSVRIQTLAGSYSPKGPYGAEIRLVALKEPEKIQQIIWEFLKERTKKI